jgi:hypothetical protein
MIQFRRGMCVCVLRIKEGGRMGKIWLGVGPCPRCSLSVHVMWTRVALSFVSSIRSETKSPTRMAPCVSSIPPATCNLHLRQVASRHGRLRYPTSPLPSSLMASIRSPRVATAKSNTRDTGGRSSEVLPTAAGGAKGGIWRCCKPQPPMLLQAAAGGAAVHGQLCYRRCYR